MHAPCRVLRRYDGCCCSGNLQPLFYRQLASSMQPMHLLLAVHKHMISKSGAVTAGAVCAGAGAGAGADAGAALAHL